MSVRKFDVYGDWHFFVEVGRMIRHPNRYLATTRGTDTTFADEYFYDFNT